MANLITPVGTVAYPSLWVPRLSKNPEPGEVAKYQITLLFRPEDEETDEFKAIVKEFNRLLIDKLTLDKAKALLKDGKIKPIIKRDIESAGYPPEYSCYLRAQNKSKPGVFSTKEDPIKRGKPALITDPEEIYPGARGRAHVALSYYEIPGKSKGITTYLNGFQKTADGDRIDGRVASADAFGFTERADEADLALTSDDNMEDLLS